MRRRRPIAVRRRGARRRPHRAVPGDAGGLALARLQGHPGPVFRAINRAPPAILLSGIAGYSPRKARISWTPATIDQPQSGKEKPMLRVILTPATVLAVSQPAL